MPPVIEDFFAHYTEMELGRDPVPSPFPAAMLEVLEDVLASPLHGKITGHVASTGKKIPLALSAGADVAFSVIDKTLYYTTDLATYLDTHEHNIEHTLGSLTAHVLGYVIEDFNDMTIPEEGVYVCQHYENVYRAHKGLPLRCTYVVPGDVC